ncbi:hypothetical protein AB1N83_007309 [Pleurotus pulmonarius]
MALEGRMFAPATSNAMLRSPAHGQLCSVPSLAQSRASQIALCNDEHSRTCTSSSLRAMIWRRGSRKVEVEGNVIPLSACSTSASDGPLCAGDMRRRRSMVSATSKRVRSRCPCPRFLDTGITTPLGTTRGFNSLGAT